MQVILDDSFLAKLRIPEGKNRITVSDLACSGLSIELRGTGRGTWRLRFSHNGVQKCLSIGLLNEISLDEARASAFAYKKQLRLGEAPMDILKNERICPKFSEFVEKYYLPYIKSYKRCVTADQTLLDNHLLPAFGDTRMNAISRYDVVQFLQKKVSDSYKPAYCNRFLVLLGFCFNLAIKWDITGVSKNPVKDVDRLKANNKIERFLKQDEAVRLLSAIQLSPNPMLQYFVPLALLTGARKRELLDARWEDFDFQRRVWRIPTTKSGRPRHVPLTDETLGILNTLRSRLPMMLEQPELIENPWVLPNLKTGKPFRSIFNSWDTARCKAGVPDLRVHDLRHSFASALVNQGIPIYDIQKLLGHSDIKTTERYAHLAPDRLRVSASAASEVYAVMLPSV
jgi:integrase